jgi:hypothetical protein
MVRKEGKIGEKEIRREEEKKRSTDGVTRGE